MYQFWDGKFIGNLSKIFGAVIGQIEQMQPVFQRKRRVDTVPWLTQAYTLEVTKSIGVIGTVFISSQEFESGNLEQHEQVAWLNDLAGFHGHFFERTRNKFCISAHPSP